ncbi:nucleotidyltransferase domain-containing protein [Candidatus Woesearchaeota archaeon]|nr:nucleotidyltransferase domain-containing protein [Candidatus Woesearchaeota archaeon]
MLLTKTQLEIMEIFCANITKSFSIRGLSKLLNKNYKVAYQAMQGLIEKGILKKDEHQLLKLNYQKNFSLLAYIESLRAEKFLKKHKEIGLFVNEVIQKSPLGFFTLMLFGSYAAGKQSKRSDIDVLMIIEDIAQVEAVERNLKFMSENFGNFHLQVISKESVKEMILRPGKLNVVNETLNKHILFFGAEDYYRLINQV